MKNNIHQYFARLRNQDVTTVRIKHFIIDICYRFMETRNLFDSGNRAIGFCAWIYGIYSLFLLVECLDFLALLHTAEPGYHAAYTVVNVAFFIVELIVCASLTLGLLMLQISKEKSVVNVVLSILLITVIRLGLIYYLYLQTDANSNFTPYIYKQANGLSGLMRIVFLPLQIISSLLCAWVWVRAKHKMQSLQ